ncbi:hypothetical protein [Haloarchaeobius iranensis]|uniref:Uncharacterized protein n=1 Tax=Haloarchaeobius iranensis TaxID=996166 RepID=A0A1G9V4W3_9EURY|nr:hypothetical protein [Haloarchaeobius iranensis]SDM67169.1 hypothetical protein SAMN05192554_105192 [Haloarchaeobius iranensis]
MERPLVRLLVVVCCLVAAGWLAVDYADQTDERGTYPSDRALAADFEAHHGESVFLWLEVVEVTEDGFVGTFDPADTRVVVRGVGSGADIGANDQVQVYGTARPDHRIDAERVVVSHGENRSYMLVVSGLAALWALGFLLLHWRPDRERAVLTPRTGDGGES